jgi:hypothetical protein
VVEVSPPYDVSDVTSLLGVRLICEVLASSVSAGKLGRTRGGEPQTPRATEIDEREARVSEIDEREIGAAE